MTNQEVFDKVATHLLTQGKQSVNAGGTCLYRGPGGTSCAVGCLIPDKVYREEMEGNDLARLPHVRGLKTALGVGARLDPNDTRFDLLYALQGAHDILDNWWNDMQKLRDALQRIAADFGLSPAVVTNWVKE